MPTVNESELVGEGDSCTQCPDYEGAIWLCGEGFLCERCFAQLADIPEEELFSDEEPLVELQIPREHTEKAKTQLMYRRDHGTE